VKGLGKTALGKAWRFLMLVLVTLAAAGPAVGGNECGGHQWAAFAGGKEGTQGRTRQALDPEKVGATVLSEDDFASGKFLA